MYTSFLYQTFGVCEQECSRVRCDDNSWKNGGNNYENF